jgi:hypothetical protein
MAAPRQKDHKQASRAVNQARGELTCQHTGRAGQETETCLDSFLGVLEYLSEATGLSIEDIADLLASKEGPMGALVLAVHLQATNGTQKDRS